MENQAGKRVAWFAVMVAALAVALLFYLLRQSAPPPPSAPDAAAPAASPEPPPPAVVEEPKEPPPPPPSEVEESEPDDERVRALLRELSGHQLWAQWAEQMILGKILALVSTVARGESPRNLLSFLPVEGKFQTIVRGEEEFIDPRSYERYDRLVDVFLTLDSRKCAEFVRRLEPFLDRKVREIEKPGQTFRGLLVEAMGQLLQVPIVTDDIPLFTTAVVMKIGIPELEAMNPAQKHLFRMGPDNIRKVQNKLRELGRALGLDKKLAAYRPIAFSPPGQ